MKDAVFMFRAPYRKRDGSGINWPFTCTETLLNQNTNQNSIREIFVTAEHCCNDYERWDHDDNPSTPDVDVDWAVGSDLILKEEITQFNDGLSSLLKINPVKFKYKKGIYSDN